jgi:hypothetical protein
MLTERHRHGDVDLLSTPKGLLGRVRQVVEPRAPPEILGGFNSLSGGHTPALPGYGHHKGGSADRSNSETCPNQPWCSPKDDVRGLEDGRRQAWGVTMPEPGWRQRNDRARVAGLGQFESYESPKRVARNIKRVVNSAPTHLLHQGAGERRRRRPNAWPQRRCPTTARDVEGDCSSGHS